MSDFQAHIYQTNASNADSGGGALSLTSSGSDYKAQANWDVAGVGKISETLTGKAVSNQGGLTVIDLSSASGNLKLTMIQNPYESRVSYGGCAAVNGGFIYNMTVVAA